MYKFLTPALLFFSTITSGQVLTVFQKNIFPSEIDSLLTLDITNCTDGWIDPTYTHIIEFHEVKDIAYYDDNRLFFLVRDTAGQGMNTFQEFELWELDIDAQEIQVVGFDSTNQASNLTIAPDGTIYLGAFSLQKFDSASGQFVDLGAIGVAGEQMAWMASLTFLNDELYAYVKGYNNLDSPHKIVKINLDNPLQSELIAEYDFISFPELHDMATINIGCDSSVLIAQLEHDNSFILTGGIYELNINDGSLIYLCDGDSPIASPSAHQTFDCIPIIDLDLSSTGLNHNADAICINDGLEYALFNSTSPSILTNTIVDSVWVGLTGGDIDGTEEFITCNGTLCSENAGGYMFSNPAFLPNEEYMEALKNSISYVNQLTAPTEGMREISFVPFHKDYSGDTATLYLPVAKAANAGMGSTASFCKENNTVELFGLISDSPDMGGIWSPQTNTGGGTFNPQTDMEGEYFYIVEGGICPEDSAAVYVGINELPIFSFNADEYVCENDSLNIEIDLEGGSYLWSDSSVGEQMTVFDAGLYWLEYTDTLGCSWRDSIYLDEGLTVEENDHIEICEGEYVDFFGKEIYADTIACNFLTSSIGCDSIFCFNVKALPLFSQTDTAILEENSYSYNGFEFNSPGNYTVELATIHGCDSMLNLVLLEKEKTEAGVYFPNAFSPNNDGVNDEFIAYPFGGITISEFMIFDRWGSLLFSKSENIGWDGSLNGEPVLSGIYAYLAKLKYPDGSEELKHGTVNLLR